MNDKKNTNNLFAEWKEIHKGVCYYTRSPFPEQDYFFSSEPLPYCRNSASFLASNFKYDEVLFYIREQIAILKFNNPNLDRLYLESIFQTRILNWRGNKELKEFLYEFNHMKILDEAIDDVLDSDDLSKFIELDYTRHWYGDRVISLPGNQKKNKWGERSWEKHKLRTSYASQQKRNRIEEVSIEYQNENFGILPTVRDVKDATGMSDYEIKANGKGLFLNKSENKKQRIIKYLELDSNLTYKQIADKYDVTERTVTRYSKFKKLNDDASDKHQSKSAKN